MSINTGMQEPAEIRELSTAEIDAVTGAGFWEAVSVLLISIGLAIGVTTAAMAIMDAFGPDVSNG
jgi:hypothetical protein